MPHPDVGLTHPPHISLTIHHQSQCSFSPSWHPSVLRQLGPHIRGPLHIRRSGCSSLLAAELNCHLSRNLPSPAMPGHSLCVGWLRPGLWRPCRYIDVHLAVVRGDDYLSFRYHGSAKFAEVKCIVGDVFAIPKQFQTRRSIRVVDWVQCRRIISPQNSFNDVPVRITRDGGRGPNDASVRLGTIRAYDHESSGHSTETSHTR